MASPFILPEKVALRAPWSATATPVEDEEGAHILDAVVISFRNGPTYELRAFVVLPKGVVCGSRENPRLIIEDDGGWADRFFQIGANSKIEQSAVFTVLNRKLARKILSGHLVGIRYLAFLKLRSDGSPTDLSSRWEKELRTKLSPYENSLIRFTAASYEALLSWHESSPAQVLANLEGVSPNTIRNRIYIAREANVLTKPGSGRRSLNKK